ncbi:MAG: helix-turn-helix domain-containing protein, partial [Acetatifactor sp.]|nr:helix-turn-helix domain-containing protein [Acetatifactor sp.]
LLVYLLRNKGRTVTRERLLENVWDINGSFVNDNTLTVTVKRLREKLHQPICLKTVRSIGYRMDEAFGEKA